MAVADQRFFHSCPLDNSSVRREWYIPSLRTAQTRTREMGFILAVDLI